MRRLYLLSALLFALVLTADQITKVLVESRFMLGESLPLLPCFALTYVRNQGAAWGMFQGAHYLLAAFGIVAMAACVIFRKKLFGRHRLYVPALALLFSGIAGNVIDRFRLGYVVDFLDFFWGSAHFPCFNVADTAISLAVVWIIGLQWLEDRRR